MTIQKPFTGKPVQSAAVTAADVRRLQQQMKRHAREMLENEALVPKEIIFVGRSMNHLRSVNKSFGAPVNRVNVLTERAVAALAAEGGGSFGWIESARYHAALSSLSLAHSATNWYNWAAEWIAPGALAVPNLEERLEKGEQDMFANMQYNIGSDD